MKSVNREFQKTVNLIKSAANSNIMLINETSPCMVRLLCNDNIFRTFKITENEKNPAKIDISLNTVTDPEERIVDVISFLDEESKKLDKITQDQIKKEAATKKANLLEAAERRGDVPTKKAKTVKKKTKKVAKKKATKKKTSKKK